MKILNLFKKLFGISSFLFLHGCLHNPDHFKWDLSINNYSAYPTIFSEIQLSLSDGNILTLNENKPYVGHYDWHNGNSPSFQRNIYGYKGLPKQARLSWYSFREKKYYSGTIELPQDKMLSMFKEGTVNYENGKDSTYSSIQFATRKDGNIDLFLWDRYYVRYVSSFQVPEAGPAFEKMSDSEVNAYIKEYGFSLSGKLKNTYEEISKTFNFDFQFKSSAKLQNGELEYSNGESSFFNEKHKSDLALREKERKIFSIPTKITLSFKDDNKLTKLRTVLDINFNEAYKILKDLDHSTKVKFTVEVNGEPYIQDSHQHKIQSRKDLCKVYIEFEGKKVPLKLFSEQSYWNVRPNSGYH